MSILQLSLFDDNINICEVENHQYRSTPLFEKVVPEIVSTGDIITTNYNTGPYVVVKISGPYTKSVYDDTYHPPCYSLLLAGVVEFKKYHGKLPKNFQYSYINELVAIDGRLLKLFKANTDEVFIVKN